MFANVKSLTALILLCAVAGVLGASYAFADAGAFAAALGGTKAKVGIGLAILGGVVQLVLGVALAITSIVIGLKILGRLLPDLEVTEALKARNRAVGAMSAGVVIAYTKVLSTGITQISNSVSVAPSIAAFLGGVVNVAVGIGLASLGVTWAFKALDRVTPTIELGKELAADNLGIGLFVAGVLYGVSEMIAAAVSGIGQALASGLSGLF